MGYIKVQTSVPVAQLDRASASGVEGLAFESRRAYHFFCLQNTGKLNELQPVLFFAVTYKVYNTKLHQYNLFSNFYFAVN